ncbi:MAG: glycosyltransferase family 4 protein [Anaerolineales bacterium]
MRILYLSQYFPPEVGATQTRAYEMASNWVRMGHSVTVISEIPNHPSGIIPPEYRYRLYEISTLDGVDVIRVWVKASPKKNFRSRMLFYLSYMLSAALAGVLLARDSYDLIYATSPPLFVGAAALFLSWARRLPLCFEVRDLWPESAVTLGELSNRRAIALATRLEQACYRRAKLIVVVTRGIQERLLQRGIPQDHLAYIANGANVDLFNFSETGRNQVRQSLGLQGKFIAIYAGIHGIAQGLESVIEAARLLQDESKIHILLVGDGPQKADLQALAESYSLPNLTLLPEQPRQLIVDYLSAADVALIPLRNLELFTGALPSKMFDAWACQRPVLLSVDGEARQVLQQAQAGIYIPPEDPQALAQALRKLEKSPHSLQQMGKNGRQYTVEHFSRKAQAQQLARELARVL